MCGAITEKYQNFRIISNTIINYNNGLCQLVHLNSNSNHLLNYFISIPSMALYIAKIVTIVRHKKFHNSFYAGKEKICEKFLPFITIFVYFVPIFVCWPAFKMNTILILTMTGRSFLVYEAGDAPINNYLGCISAVFSVIFMGLCILLNICTFVAYKLHMKKVSINGNNNSDNIEKKLLFYAMATFLGHAFVASVYLINIITKLDDWKTRFMVFVYGPLMLDTGTVMLSSWLLLWASGTFRQQLFKDFAIIRKTNHSNNRVDAMEGPQNNNHLAVGGAVGQQ